MITKETEASKNFRDLLQRAGVDEVDAFSVLTVSFTHIRPCIRKRSLPDEYTSFMATDGGLGIDEYAKMLHEIASGRPDLRGFARLFEDHLTSMDSQEVARWLGLGVSQVEERASSGELASFVDLSGERRYPTWQFEGGVQGDTIPNLRTLLAGIPDYLHHESLREALTARSFDLRIEEHGIPISPLDWLRLGLDPERAVEAIEKYHLPF